jgi:hypothetical protein
MKNKFSIPLIIVGLRLCAWSQVQSGTLIAVTSSPDEIVVAADSRTHDGTRYVDNHCKISTFGNKVIFAAAGFTGEGPLAGPAYWSVQAIARRQFDRFSGKNARPYSVVAFANAWGKATEIKIQRLLDRHTITRETITDKSNVITNSVFAGFGKPGKVSIVLANMLYETNKGRGISKFSVQQIVNEPGGEEEMGHTEVVNQIQGGNLALIREMAQDRDRLPSGFDLLAFYMIEMVKLSIKHQAGVMINGIRVETIGGPIDAVRLSRSGGIEWINRKDNCPAN